MSRNLLKAALAACAAVAAAGVTAQVNPTPQQRYESQIAYCNSGKLPDPQRNACVRDAGLALDRATGGTPANVAAPSKDGRATIVSPAGLPPPNSGSDEITSRDGRATIVLPANQPPPPSN